MNLDSDNFGSYKIHISFRITWSFFKSRFLIMFKKNILCVFCVTFLFRHSTGTLQWFSLVIPLRKDCVPRQVSYQLPLTYMCDYYQVENFSVCGIKCFLYLNWPPRLLQWTTKRKYHPDIILLLFILFYFLAQLETQYYKSSMSVILNQRSNIFF